MNHVSWSYMHQTLQNWWFSLIFMRILYALDPPKLMVFPSTDDFLRWLEVNHWSSHLIPLAALAYQLRRSSLSKAWRSCCDWHGLLRAHASSYYLLPFRFYLSPLSSLLLTMVRLLVNYPVRLAVHSHRASLWYHQWLILMLPLGRRLEPLAFSASRMVVLRSHPIMGVPPNKATGAVPHFNHYSLSLRKIWISTISIQFKIIDTYVCIYLCIQLSIHQPWNHELLTNIKHWLFTINEPSPCIKNYA